MFILSAPTVYKSQMGQNHSSANKKMNSKGYDESFKTNKFGLKLKFRPRLGLSIDNNESSSCPRLSDIPSIQSVPSNSGNCKLSPLTPIAKKDIHIIPHTNATTADYEKFFISLHQKQKKLGKELSNTVHICSDLCIVPAYLRICNVQKSRIGGNKSNNASQSCICVFARFIPNMAFHSKSDLIFIAFYITNRQRLVV